MGLKEDTERYRAFNDGIARSLAHIHTPIPPKPSMIPHAILCDICGKKGPESITIASAAMLAQKEGFTYSLVGRVKWYCPGCKR